MVIRFVASFDCLSLLTDYGLDDGFVGVCHGVAARIAPACPVIDLTHLVPAGDVRRGAAVLAQAVPYLPPAVHVAVVDPGVGTSRRAVAVAAGPAILVGPDNGLLVWAADALGGASAVYELTNERLWLHPVSRTFHGRDIFMPVAAHLATGVELASAGPEVDPAGLTQLPAPVRRVTGQSAEGEVISIDRFGNLALSIMPSDLAQLAITPGSRVSVQCGEHHLVMPYGDTFGAVSPGAFVCYTDSSGMTSLAVNRGNAAHQLGVPPGAYVLLSPEPST